MRLTNIFINDGTATPLQILLSMIILGLLMVSVAFLLVCVIVKTRKQPRRKAWQQATGNNAFLISVLIAILVVTLNFMDKYMQGRGQEIAVLHDGKVFFLWLALFFIIFGLLRRYFWHKRPWWRGYGNEEQEQTVKYALRKFRYWSLGLVAANFIYVVLYNLQTVTFHKDIIIFDRRILLISSSWIFAVIYYWMAVILKEFDAVLARRIKPLTLYTIRALNVPLRIIAIKVALNTLQLFGEFPPDRLLLFRKLNHLLIVYAVLLFTLHVVDGWHKVLIAKSKRPNSKIDLTTAQIMILGVRAVIYLTGFFTVVQIVSEQKLPAIIASLGIGGAAIALASQDLLKNIFGGFTIMLDKPFNISQRVKVQSLEGVVERIGFRSTRLRTVGGNLVTIPNATISNNYVENVALREAIRRDIVLNFPLSTTTAQMQQLINKLRELFANQGDNFDYEQRPPRVYFSDFKEWSFVINILYWHNSTDWWASVLFGETINGAIMAIMEELDIKLAIPTQSVHVEQEPTRIKPATPAQVAVAQQQDEGQL